MRCLCFVYTIVVIASVLAVFLGVVDDGLFVVVIVVVAVVVVGCCCWCCSCSCSCCC